MYIDGILFMAISKDSKGISKSPDPDAMLGAQTTIKKIIFIRHGESDWNDIFNKGIGLSLILRLILGIIREIKLFTSSDSIFIDSPLNHDGILQANELSRFLEKCDDSHLSAHEKEVIRILKGQSGTSVIVSSNLRRAISTTTIALWPRITRSEERIIILSSLQEISRNIDTRALAGPKTIPNLSRIADYCGNQGDFNAEQVYDVNECHGNKTTFFTGVKRLKSFNEWVFKRHEDAIIVGGHSLWFKYYFQVYLPHKTIHPAKKQKIVNSGVVAFDLHRSELTDGSVWYRVDPDSIVVVYGGFTTK